MSIESIVEIIKTEANVAPVEIKTRMPHLRNRLEPYIYNYLAMNHYPMLNEAWKSYAPPLNSKHVYAIIERRCHPNFDFILKNIAWANPNMAVYIFCSDENERYIYSLLGDKIANVSIVQAFTGTGSVQEGIDDYNRLLTSKSFYECFAEDAEYVLTIQMDVFIRRPITPEIFVGDYWGAPWRWNPQKGGSGGSTIRKISKMLEICSKEFDAEQDPVKQGEDHWMSERIKDLPPLAFRSKTIMESIYITNPVIVHQFWSYIDNILDYQYEIAISYLKDILTIGPENKY
jgi:hypothetical protein